jgi:streptogramin lyase
MVAEAGGFSSPHDVEIDGTGSIWIADAGNDRMVRLDDDLQIAAELSGSPYNFSGPRYMDFGPEGRMFVADKYSHSIKVISPAGALLYTLGGPESGNGEGVFDRPEGVEIRGRDLWFSDTYNNRIVRYRLVQR